MLKPLEQWQCDECGELIESRRDGTVEYRFGAHPDPRIVHNGNVEFGRCQRQPANADILLEDLEGARGAFQMIKALSKSPSWAEVARRVLVPYYEEARHYLEQYAREIGDSVHLEKVTEAELKAIVNRFGGDDD